jgi:hypothetical protein
MGKARIILMESTLSTEQCWQRLRTQTDEQRRALFALSGYAGERPVLSRIEGDQFQLQKRRYYRNDFAPNFYGTIRAWGNTARVEGHFGPPRWVMRFWKIWLAAAVVFTLPPIVIVLQKLPRDIPRISMLAGLLAPLSLIALGLLLPRFGEWLGRNEKIFLLQFMETMFSAKTEFKSLTD